MATGCNETITSLDLNFSNGGGHTATVTTVKGAKDLASGNQDSLGSLIGTGGGKTTFTNEKLQNLLTNFTEVSNTVSQDARKTSILRKYEDNTSLLLKSHAIIIRGRDANPKSTGAQGGQGGQGNNVNTSLGAKNIFGGCPSREKIPVNMSTSPVGLSSNAGALNDPIVLAYFAEVVGSPVSEERKFGYNPPTKSGALIYAGNIYNEESSVNISGEKVSLVYQNGQLKENLSFNSDSIGDFYKQFPDYANYQLKYGYTLREVKSIFQLAGITVLGLPTSDSILLTESGSLDSVLSSIASKFGYYWYADPSNAGRIIMVNSVSAAGTRVTNPLTQDGSLKSKYVSGSITTDYKSPKIVDAYASTIERSEITFEIPDGDRLTRFHKWKPLEFVKTLNFNHEILQYLYILYASGKFESSQLFSLYTIIATVKHELEWGDEWPDGAKHIANGEAKWKKYDQIFGDDGQKAKKLKEKTPGFDFQGAKYIPLFANGAGNNKLEDVYNTDVFNKLKDYFDAITSSLYISNKFGRWKATRMAFKNSPLSIEGPFELKDTLEETDGLENFKTAMKRNGKDLSKLKIGGFWDSSQDTVGGGDFAFFASSDKNNKSTLDLEATDLKWKEICDEKAFYPSSKGGEALNVDETSRTYVAVSTDFIEKIEEMMEKSKTLFNKLMTDEGGTMKATYTRAKRPVSVGETEEDKKKEEARSKRIDALNERAQQLDELRERFDLRKYSVEKNGASGSPLHPVQLNVSNMSLSDVKTISEAGVSGAQSNQGPMYSSSRTIVGLALPERFSVQMSGISLKLGASGITTTITESTLKILRPDEQVILANGQASTSRDFASRFTAGQKNFMGL
tara:strand:+ start:3972 stop:6524 length:2553 start_codon:yes stop_codon:yes gene_type:complete